MLEGFDQFLSHLDEIELTTVHGRITEIIGMLIKAIVPQVKMGEVVMIKRDGEPLMAEVVGFTREEVFLSPLGPMQGIGPSSEVIPMRLPLHIRVGSQLLGRILDGLGMPIDQKPMPKLEETCPVIAAPPNPLKRKIINEPLSVGVRCIDGILTTGKGQRMGIFSAAGVGKSTLLGMIARNAKADVNVISLIGERGREVREFLENDLGKEGLERSVVVVSTSDQAAQLRINAAFVATAIAEYFREQGKSVILMMDSITRFARAVREIGLAAGEPSARAGYTPSVFATLPRLLERSGNSDKGFMTAFYTVLVAGDDINEPISDEVRSILDGHIWLSQELAHQGHYPAIDVLPSISRILGLIINEEHNQLIHMVRDVLAQHKKIELLLRIGEYKPGSDKGADNAIKYIDKVRRFLQQKIHERPTFEETLAQLRALFR
jgi:ATP synthase in type III secretion protein N